jgi:XisI protein
MDQLNHHRDLIKQVLNHHAQSGSHSNDLEIQTLFNDLQNDYQMLCLGWHDDDRIHRCLIHIQIKDRKIWIEQDETEVGIANELVEAGVSKADIVLAYQAPYLRPLTEFAVG